MIEKKIAIQKQNSKISGYYQESQYKEEYKEGEYEKKKDPPL